MPKFMILIAVVAGAAIAFGFLSAAALATDLGLVVATTVAALVAMSVAFQGAHLFDA